jgi:S1-C subfamily serine protease
MPTILEQLSDDLATAVDRAAGAVVAIHARRRIPSTGIIWTKGLIVATDHTVHKEEDIDVVLADGTKVQARVTGRDQSTDICILAFDGDCAPATLDVSPLRVGQLTLAVGRPGSHATATLGVISAVSGEWRTARGGRIDQLVRLDMSVYDGFSGSPLVTASGAVAGLCTSGLTRGGAVAIPAKTVERVVEALRKNGGLTRRGYLGINTQVVPLPESMRDRLAPIGGSVPRFGLMIVSVQDGSAAERAGILLGDLLVGLGGQAMEDPRDVFAALGPDSVGKTLDASIIRGGQLTTRSVTIDPHPDEH